MVSVHTFAMTRPAFKSMDPAEDGFTSDVARWLHNGQNTLSVVLMGPLPLEMRLRMEVAQDGQAAWLLDETDMLLIATPCRLWNQTLGKSTAPPAEMQAGRLLTNC